MNATVEPSEANPEVRHTETAEIKPLYNVHAQNQDHTVQIEMPGVRKEDVSVSLEGNILTVRAKRTALIPATARVLHRELESRGYKLCLKLSPEVDADRLSAVLNDGILALHLPQRAAESPRQIAVL